jgi:crossover junction endodeoxyribonuclease RuvC
MRRVCFGIDPGIGRLGYGVVIQEGAVLKPGVFGCITTLPSSLVQYRILQVCEKLEPLIQEASPDLISIERLFFGRNTTTAENVYQVRGAVLFLAARKGIPGIQPKPAEVKMAVCGHGRAEKQQVQRMIFRILNMEEFPYQDDAADALGSAITGLALFDLEMRTRNGG